MPARTLLLVGQDSSLAQSHDPSLRCVGLPDLESALDWLWEQGDAVQRLVVRSDMIEPEFCRILKQDWPQVSLEVTTAAERVDSETL